MSRLDALERRILDYAGVAAADVAKVLGIGTRRVELVRERCGRDTADGNPPSHAGVAAVDFDHMMRSNRGVCG